MDRPGRAIRDPLAQAAEVSVCQGLAHPAQWGTAAAAELAEVWVMVYRVLWTHAYTSILQGLCQPPKSSKTELFCGNRATNPATSTIDASLTLRDATI
ncbi:MAG: hypothetical protein ACI9R3_001565 [Verrucomicrobiales bacterium]